MPLIHTESGRVILLLSEPLTEWRRARKLLRLEASPSAAATLHCLVWVRAGHSGPLRLTVNGHPLEYRAPAGVHHLHWASLPIPAAWLQAGDNLIELWSDAATQTAWSLGLESGHVAPGSFLSTDSGATWRNQAMGPYHTDRAEYVVRLAVGEPQLTTPPPFAWEDRATPRLGDLRALIAPDTLALRDPWQRARALASQVAAAWPYQNQDDSSLYAPWDPATILAWQGDADLAPGYHGPAIRMCVHYAVLFTGLCLATGIAARCVVCTDHMGGESGHFVAEVWHPALQQWCLIDPNLDLVFIEDGRPLSMEEVSTHPGSLATLVDYGPGHAAQLPRMNAFMAHTVLPGHCFRMYGVWRRNDFLSHPEHTPPSHGHAVYCETDIVWREPAAGAAAVGMFPYITGLDWFQQPPPQEMLSIAHK